MNRKPVLVVAAFFALLLGGCASHDIPNPLRTGPFFEPKNFIGDLRMPATIRRVVILPVHGAPFAPPEMSEALDQIFATALEKQLRFEVVVLSREDCQKTYGVPDFSSAASLPHEFLTDIGNKFGAQAVLFVDLTAYQAYRPLQLGVRSKLATIAGTRLVWSFDDVFSATDPGVINGIHKFFQSRELGSSVPFDLSTDNLESPSRFAAYAADTTFKTLPPR